MAGSEMSLSAIEGQLEGIGGRFVKGVLLPIRRYAPALKPLTTANAVTVGRLCIFFVPSIVFLSLDWYLTAALLFAIASVLDLVDGWIARWDSPTLLGAWLDSTADKLMTIPTLLIAGGLGLYHVLMWPAIVLLVSVDVVNLGINTRNLFWSQQDQSRATGQSNDVKARKAGKIKMWAIAISLIASMLYAATSAVAFSSFAVFCLLVALYCAYRSLRGKLNRLFNRA